MSKKTTTKPIEFLLQFDRIGRTCIVEASDKDAEDVTNIILDVGATPDFIVCPATIRREIEKSAEIRRTLVETMRTDAAAMDRVEAILLLIHARFITLLKYLIAVYNFFHVPNMNDPGERFSTLLDPRICQELSVTILMMDAALMDDGIDSSECTYVLRNINETMKVIFDMLATIAGGDQVKSGIGKLREAYRAFHVRHRGVPNAFAPSHRLCAAFAKVADYFGGKEGIWMRDRPEPTLRKPAFGIFIGKHIFNKIVGEHFGRSENMIVNWNKGKGRPFDYEGPYPDTPEGNDRMIRDAELFRIRKANKKLIMKMDPEELRKLIAANKLPSRYAQFKYDPLFAVKQRK